MLSVYVVRTALLLLPTLLSVGVTQAADFRFAKGFTHYQRAYAEVKATRHGNICVLSGMAKPSDGKKPTRTATVGFLSPDCRPGAALILETNNHTDRARINVRPDGRVEWASGFNYPWVSMDGVTFPVGRSSNGLALSSGWANYSGWQGAGWYRQGKQCFLSGLIRPTVGTKLPATVATVPAECRPSHRLVFRQQNTRIDVFPNGQVQLRNGEIGPWVSLSGIEYHAGKIGGSLKFVNGWSNYSTTYKAASYYVDGNGICSLSGLIKGSDYRGMVLLPSNCRPDARLIMNVQAAGNGHTRVDIMPNGEVRFVRGDQGGWVSLSGIVVPVQPTASAPAPKKPLARKAPVSKTQVAAISAIAPTAFSQVQRDRLSQLSQSVQSRVERVLTSTDRRTVGQMQEEAAAIAKMRQGAARKRAVDTFNNKHARFRNDIVRRARIDDAFFLSETRKILPQHNLRRVGNVYLSTSNNRLSSSHTSEPADTPEETAQVAQSASTTLFDVESHSSGCTDYTSMVDDDDKTFSALAISYIAGGCESITSLGSNIQVPAGTSIVRVRIILDDGFLLSNAATGVAGYGQSYTEIGIRVKGPGVDEYYADSDQLVIAPVAYSADIKKEEFGNYVMEVEVSPSSSGGVYQIQAYAKSSSMGVAGGLGVGYARVGDMGLIETWFE